jgi:hypothetical protein
VQTYGYADGEEGPGDQCDPCFEKFSLYDGHAGVGSGVCCMLFNAQPGWIALPFLSDSLAMRSTVLPQTEHDGPYGAYKVFTGGTTLRKNSVCQRSTICATRNIYLSPWGAEYVRQRADSNALKLLLFQHHG